MKKFLKTTAMSVALVALFGSTMFVTTGCDFDDCSGDKAEEVLQMTYTNSSSSVTENGSEDSVASTETSAEAQNAEAQNAESSDNGSETPSGDEVKLESATYLGGEGGEAMYEIVMIVSPELVKKGFNVGDVFASFSGKPSLEKWDGINTYDPSMGKEEDLPDGSKRITWKTSIYFPDKAPNAGDSVTLGVNAAGQDADGNWSETEVTGTVEVKWAN